MQNDQQQYKVFEIPFGAPVRVGKFWIHVLVRNPVLVLGFKRPKKPEHYVRCVTRGQCLLEVQGQEYSCPASVVKDTYVRLGIPSGLYDVFGIKQKPAHC